MRYFADGSISLKAIASGLKQIDPAFKIDGGELTRGEELLGEIEISSAGSDLFGEDLAAFIGQVERSGAPAARDVSGRLRAAQAIVTLNVLDNPRDPNLTWEMIGPLWSVLPTLATGLTQVDGRGFYDGSELLVTLG